MAQSRVEQDLEAANSTEEKPTPTFTAKLFAGVTLAASMPGHVAYACANSIYDHHEDIAIRYGFPSLLFAILSTPSCCTPKPVSTYIFYATFTAYGSMFLDEGFSRIPGMPIWGAPLATAAVTILAASAPSIIQCAPKIIERCCPNLFSFWHREPCGNSTTSTDTHMEEVRPLMTPRLSKDTA